MLTPPSCPAPVCSQRGLLSTRRPAPPPVLPDPAHLPAPGGGPLPQAAPRHQPAGGAPGAVNRLLPAPHYAHCHQRPHLCHQPSAVGEPGVHRGGSNCCCCRCCSCAGPLPSYVWRAHSLAAPAVLPAVPPAEHGHAPAPAAVGAAPPGAKAVAGQQPAVGAAAPQSCQGKLWVGACCGAGCM